MQITLDVLKAKLLEENLKDLFIQAYDQGLNDAKENYALPLMLRKQDVANLFQVALPTVENIIRMEGFPKSKVITARYPRDRVLDWADNEDNVEIVSYLRGHAI